MRAFWTGDVELGIIPIPVKMYTATKDLTPQFHQLHDVCGTRITLARRCSKCERDLAWEEIVKGHEVAPGEFVAFTKEELAGLSDFDGKGVIKILHTMKLSDVDPRYLDAVYYLAPSSKRVQMYNLLRDEMGKTGLVAIGTVALRTRPKLCMLTPAANLIALTTMHYAAEIVDASELVPPVVPLRPQDQSQARALLESMVEEFHPENHTDEYVKKLMVAVQEKVESGETVEGGEKSGGGGGDVVDLGELLKRSLDAQARAKGKTKTKGAARSNEAAPPSGAGEVAPKTKGAARSSEAAPPSGAGEAAPKPKKGKEREGHTPSRRAS